MPNTDGSVTIHFGGNERAPNYLPITPGVELRVPHVPPAQGLLDGTWKVPEAHPVK